MNGLYSPDGIEPFLEYQTSSPPEGTAGKDSYFPPTSSDTSVAWSRRKSLSSRTKSLEYAPRPIFESSNTDSTTDSSAPASPPPTPARTSSGLLRRKSSKASSILGKKSSLTQLGRKASQQSKTSSVTSPVLSAMVVPPTPPETTTSSPLPPSSPPLPPPVARLSPQLEQPTPPLTPEPPSVALFQPPPAAIANRTPPYAAVAGPPPLASANSLGRASGGGGSSRRTSDSSYNDREGGTPLSSSSSVTSTGFGSPVGGRGKAPADLSNPWRSQTERPLDTVRRMSRQVDSKDLSYQANRHSAYGAASSMSFNGVRLDDDSGSSSSATPYSSPVSPWAGLSSTMNMTGPYPTTNMPPAMVGPYPMPGRSAVTPFALDASPWPMWHGGASSSDSDQVRSGSRSTSGTIKRKGGTKARAASDAGAGGKNINGLSVQPSSSYSRSPLSQASSPEPPTPPAGTSPSSTDRPATLGRTKSARRRLSFWRKKDEEGGEDTVPPLPEMPAGVKAGKGGRDRVASVPPPNKGVSSRSRRATSEPAASIAQEPSPAPSPAAVSALPNASPSRATPSPAPPQSAGSIFSSVPPPAPAAVPAKPPTTDKSAPMPVKAQPLPPKMNGRVPPSGQEPKSSNSGGFGSLFRRFSSFGRKSTIDKAAIGTSKLGSGGSSSGRVNEMGQVVGEERRVAMTQPQLPALSTANAKSGPSPSVEAPQNGSARPAKGPLSSPRTDAPQLAFPPPPPRTTSVSPARKLEAGAVLASALPILSSSARPNQSPAPGPVDQQQSVPAPAPQLLQKSPSSVRRLPKPPGPCEMSDSASELPWAGTPSDGPKLPGSPSRRMSKKASNGSLPPAPSSPTQFKEESPRRLPDATSPRNRPLPASPSPNVSALSQFDGASLSPYAQGTHAVDKPALARHASDDGKSPVSGPPPLVRASSSPSASRPTSPPPASVHQPTDLTYTEADVPALDDTPSNSHTSSSTIATPFWDPNSNGQLGGEVVTRKESRIAGEA